MRPPGRACGATRATRCTNEEAAQRRPLRWRTTASPNRPSVDSAAIDEAARRRGVVQEEDARGSACNLPRGLVLSLALIRDLAQKAVLGPRQVCHLDDDLRTHPMHA